MLAVVYLTLTAKPLSLRRLLLLFIFALTAGNVVFAAFHLKHGPHTALVTAAGITFLMWSMPLMRLVYGAIRFRTLSPAALAPASGFILWSYGFILAFVPMLTISIMTDRAREIPLGILVRLASAAILVGTLLLMGRRSKFFRDVTPDVGLQIRSHGEPVYLTTERSRDILEQRL